MRTANPRPQEDLFDFAPHQRQRVQRPKPGASSRQRDVDGARQINGQRRFRQGRQPRGNQSFDGCFGAIGRFADGGPVLGRQTPQRLHDLRGFPLLAEIARLRRANLLLGLERTNLDAERGGEPVKLVDDLLRAGAGHRRPRLRSPRRLDDFLEGVRIGDRQIGQNLSVQLDVRFVQTANQTRVRNAKSARRRVDADDPQAAEVGFLLAPMEKREPPFAVHRLDHRFPEFRPSAPKALGVLPNAVTAMTRFESTFGAGHVRESLLLCFWLSWLAVNALVQVP